MNKPVHNLLSDKPDTSTWPELSDKPDTSTWPELSDKPDTSTWPELSDKPDKTVSPATLQATPSQEESAHSEITKPVHFGFNIGTSPAAPTTKELEEMIRRGHLAHPSSFPMTLPAENFQHLC
eukprot:gene7264-12951_t